MNVLHVALTILSIFSFIPAGMFQLPSSNRKCVIQGAFPINDGTCEKYYICVYNGLAFASYDLMCASSTIFDPIMRYCVSSTEYSCTQTTSSSTTSTTPATTTSSTTSTTPATTSSSTASTTPATTSSSTTSTTPATTSSTTSTTPATTSSTTSTTPATTTSTTIATTTPALTCTKNGRFEIKDPIKNPNCQFYYFCFWNGANFIKYTLKCPTILQFNPIVQKCVLPFPPSCPWI
ncbi:uncharacterized protein LOC143151640 [Ptiloglossa arizonensis]|uniref:uncharacterized protein LOC143151640 n=1 Tax=Ptiloglossa arizonensis TaxID=3350558 RepID=UPI003F9FEF8E